MRTITSKLILSSVLFAVLTTGIYTALTLMTTVSSTRQQFNQSIDQFKSVHLPSLEEAIWNFDESQVQQIIDGVTTSAYIKRIEVEALPYMELESGVIPHQPDYISLPINREDQQIAFIRLYPDEKVLAESIQQKVIDAFYFLVIFLPLQAIAIFFVVKWSVLDGLKLITGKISQLSFDHIGKQISFPRKQPYEIELIKDSINDLSQRLEHEQTKARAYQLRLEEESNYDSVTRLPNRKNCQNYLQQCIAEGDTDPLFVIYLDFINFKSINSLHGNAAGDEFLVLTKSTIERLYDRDFYISRYGNDRFVLLNKVRMKEAEISTVAGRLKSVLEEMFYLRCAEAEVSLTTAIGIAQYPKDFTNSERLLLSAERMAKVSKKSARIVFYQGALDKEINDRDHIRHLLFQAVKEHDFFLNYQPIVDLSTGVISGYEALIRWYSSELGFVPPDAFIGIAEEEGMIIRIEEWVIQQACSDIARLSEYEGRAINIAINVSYLHFISETFIETLKKVLAETGLSASQLEIELTERVLAEDGRQLEMKMRYLKSMGVKISIDDFGTGYSALNYIKDFSFDLLKIDKSFVQSMLSNDKNQVLVKNIIRLAQDLDIRVIAEGIEQQEQYQKLKQFNCNYGQGYMLSKPARYEELEPGQQF